MVTGYEDKSEVEKEFGVSISSDVSLWESNEFMQYVGAEWMQDSVERVVLLFTYLALNSVAKLSVSMAANTFEEFVDLPWGRQDQNAWVVYGYVDERTRIVRSKEGQSA